MLLGLSPLVSRAWTRLTWTAGPASLTERPGKATVRLPVHNGESKFLLRFREAEPENGAGGLRVAVRRCRSYRNAFDAVTPRLARIESAVTLAGAL